MISNAVNTFTGCAIAPTFLANASYNKGGCKNNLTARALSVVQAIVSLVALPLTLLGLIFAPALACCIEGKEGAVTTAKLLGMGMIAHPIAIPFSMIAAIFAPEMLTIWD